jgi:membrane fusion protein YbhG
MKSLIIIAIPALLLLFSGCNDNGEKADAYGNFEVDETIISAQMPGELLFFNVDEGARIKAGAFIGLVDTMELSLLKPELIANRRATASKASNVVAQIDVLKDQLANLVREQNRAKNLIKAGAATQKQLDDIEGQINVVKSQMQSVLTQNASILGQVEALDAKLAQIEEKIRKSKVINPINGIVLVKLTEAYEFVAPGKPLYKIANTDNMDLRVFLPGSQLSTVEIGKEYTVKIDGKDGVMLNYTGKVIWISEEAEFTPKTIQTKKERVDLVYAVKLRVKNDGKIKIGMPGELWVESK